MAAFEYIGRDGSGAQVKGVIDAANAGAAAEQLSRQRIIPISINEKAQDVQAANIDLNDLLGFDPVSLD